MVLAFIIFVVSMLFLGLTLVRRIDNAEDAMSNAIICGIFILIAAISGLAGFVLLVIKVATL